MDYGVSVDADSALPNNDVIRGFCPVIVQALPFEHAPHFLNYDYRDQKVQHGAYQGIDFQQVTRDSDSLDDFGHEELLIKEHEQ